jgi:hypothetical protein
MSNQHVDQPNPKVLVGNWWALHFASGLAVMLQFRFYDDGNFEFADYSRGSRTFGTYTVIDRDLVLKEASDDKERRRHIISYLPSRLTLEFHDIGAELQFTPDRPVP